MYMYDGDPGVVLEASTNARTLIDVMVTHDGETMIVPLYPSELRPALDRVVVTIRRSDSDRFDRVFDGLTRFTWRDYFDFWINHHPDFAGDWRVIHCDTGRILERGTIGTIAKEHER
jgi:hypothetical protein